VRLNKINKDKTIGPRVGYIFMETNRLSPSIAQALNEQMTNEAHNAQIYLAYASWAADKGYDGIANFLFRHANEERNHMMKFLEYILKRGGKVVVSAIPAPGDDPVSVYDCFEKVFKSEVENTGNIYRIVEMSMAEKDWATWNFIQWFVKEQTEEETLALDLLSKIKVAGGANAKDDALYALDVDLKNTPDDATLAQEVTVENP
jgi:ferritin